MMHQTIKALEASSTAGGGINGGYIYLAVVLVLSLPVIFWGERKQGNIWYPSLRRDIQAALTVRKDQVKDLSDVQVKQYVLALRRALREKKSARSQDPELNATYSLLRQEEQRRRAERLERFRATQ